MPPEREISEDQSRAISDWIYDVKGGRLVKNLLPGFENGVWNVDEEPIVVYSKDVPVYDEFGNLHSFTQSRPILFCSEKHAQELEEAGIVDFSETSSQPQNR